jgi:shikimate dehydrogenase
MEGRLAHMEKVLLGLIGAGIQRSRTPALHEYEAAAHNLNCVYQLIDLERLGLSVDALPDLLLAAERMGFAGLNITHPCKQAVLAFLTEISDDARALGAVNTVVLQDGRRAGHNTDWVAFHEAMSNGLPGVPLGRIVQLGAGGGGSATAYAALRLGAGHVRIIDTEPERSAALAARLNQVFGEGKASASRDAGQALRDADGLIHATPAGMSGHPGLPLPADLLRRELWVAEIVYFPLETELLQHARSIGCRTLDGSRMAVGQAVEAFRLFTGEEPDRARMHRYFLAMTEVR